MAKRGVVFPVLDRNVNFYTMEWCQEEEAWVGRCQEISAPPALSLLDPPSKPQRKPRRRRSA